MALPPLWKVTPTTHSAAATYVAFRTTWLCNADSTLQMDLYNFKTHAMLGSFTGHGSGSWGWIHEGREFGAIGQADGTAFVEIGPNGELLYLGRLPQHGEIQRYSAWREIRIYKDYLLIGSEAYDHGVQIFDMKNLLELDPASPKNFTLEEGEHGHFINYDYMPWGRLHNLVVNEELDYAAALGSAPRFNHSCASGLVWIDLKDPANPVSPGCAGQDGYVHDAQCVVYHGPDTRYEGKDICFGYNEDTLTIYDATVKEGVNQSVVLSKLSYVGATYTHQGWFIDQDWHQYILLDDEYDEDEFAGPAADQYPVTYILDVSNLEDPKQTGIYKHDKFGVDHNQYVFDGLAYQSNYGIGLTVLDVSGIPEDPTGGNVEEVAWFDIYPEDDHLEKQVGNPLILHILLLTRRRCFRCGAAAEPDLSQATHLAPFLY
jgi:choice-of-anchor B domain-containing protein